MKIRNLIITVVALVPMISMADNTKKITLKGAKAESLILGFLLSGVEGQHQDKKRFLAIDNLTTVYGYAQHECDDEEILCGFKLPGGLQSVQQNGKIIETTEAVQLFDLLTKIVDPILAAKQIENTDAAMGRSYTDYGKINCSWKLSNGSPYNIQNATCEFDVSDYQ